MASTRNMTSSGTSKTYQIVPYTCKAHNGVLVRTVKLHRCIKQALLLLLPNHIQTKHATIKVLNQGSEMIPVTFQTIYRF